jgi:hypothetical protein
MFDEGYLRVEVIERSASDGGFRVVRSRKLPLQFRTWIVEDIQDLDSYDAAEELARIWATPNPFGRPYG